MISSFLNIKYPYNQISNSCSTWINHRDLWRLINAMESLNDISIEDIKSTNYDCQFLNYKNCYCFNDILNNYYLDNWLDNNIDTIKDDTVILIFRLVIFSCTKGKMYKDIQNPLEKIKSKSNLLLVVSKIDALNSNTDRLLKLYINASNEILPSNIVGEIKVRIMELKLKKE